MTNEHHGGATVGDETRAFDSQSLVASLAPVLIQMCEGRLRDIRWFRADWQRGGAATGRAAYLDHNNVMREVVVKVPVGTAELRWTRLLQESDDATIVPRLFASGDQLGSYDIGWLVMERLPHGPLGAMWRDEFIRHMAEAAARFSSAASAHPVDRPASTEDWTTLVEQSRESVRVNRLAESQRWLKALKRLGSNIDAIVAEWRARPISEWVHGDLHPANAMAREPLPDAKIALIDLAQVRPGWWIEDAVYLERLFWAHPEHIRQFKPVKTIAEARRSLGLMVRPDDTRLAMIRRILLAGTAPRFLKTEGSPTHLAACLNRLEAGLSELGCAE